MDRGIISRACSSLTARLLVVVMCYVAVLIASFAAVSSLVSARLDSAFPSMDAVLAQQDALEGDRFNELSRYGLSRCGIVIFDSQGNRLYASSREAAADLTYSLARSLGEFDVVEEEDFAGLASCIVQRHDYETADGNTRTLLLASPIMNEAAYGRIVSESGQLWLILIPLVGAATAVAAVAIAKVVKRAVRPLDEAISSYRSNAIDTSRDTTVTCTELSPIHDSFIELMDRLQKEEAEKQRLMADISHDLKTPLTVIKGYAHALKENQIPPSKQTQYLTAIAERSATAAHLLEDLFSLTKTEHPDYIANKSEVDVFEIVRRIVIAHSIDIEEAGLSIEARIPDEAHFLLVDERLLNRALSNLIDNAVKHNAEGAVVCVECAYANGKVTIRVANTGRRIPDNIRDNIFDPFVTNDDARTSGGGTGLGLAIAQRCMELNGGRVFLEKNPPAPFAASFVCELPDS